MITSVPGASAVFLGSIVAYDNNVKLHELDVNPETLERFGAVSEETAREMAEGIVRTIGNQFAIGVTGIAGPDGGTEEKPVGTIWIALAERSSPTMSMKTIAKKLQGRFWPKAES